MEPSQPDSNSGSAATPEERRCPPADSWGGCVAGLFAPEECRDRIRHAASCEHCRPLLREAAEHFGGENDEVAQEVNLLPSSGDPGRWNLALRLRNERAAEAGGLRRGMVRLVWACAALTLAMVAVLSYRAYMHADSDSARLARAYTADRWLELRIEGATYTPQRTAQGPARSRPLALQEVEGTLAAELERDPHNSQLLDLQARAYLLEGDFNSAKDDLELALTSQPKSVAYLVDLASAYFERGEQMDNNTADYSQTLEYLGRSLEASPRDAVARFNRASVEERMQLYPSAIEDWKQYLDEVKGKSDGGWADVAKHRLEDAEARVAKHNAAFARPLTEPAKLARSVGAQDEVGSRAELYLDTAVTEWLPQAFPEPGAKATDASDVRAGLKLMGEILRERNHDAWLADMLASAPAPDAPPASASEFASAIASLATARSIMYKAQSKSLEAARIAMRKFQKIGAEPGYLWAQYQEIYASEQDDPPGYVAKANEILPRMRNKHYDWLTIQTLLAKGALESDEPNANAALQQDYKEASSLAQADAMPGLESRAKFYQNLLLVDANDEEYWRNSSKLLSAYWDASQISPGAASHILYNLSVAASSAGNCMAAVTLARAAAERQNAAHQAYFVALAFQYLGRLELDCNLPAEASQDFAQADSALGQVEQDDRVGDARAENALYIAATDLIRGDNEQASAELRIYESIPAPLRETLPTRSDYLQVLGRLELARGDTAAAERDLASSVAITESIANSGDANQEFYPIHEGSFDANRSWVQAEIAGHQDDERTWADWEWSRARSMRPAGAAAQTEWSTQHSAIFAELATTERKQLNYQAVSYAFLPQGLTYWFYDDSTVRQVLLPTPAVAIEAAARDFADACASPYADMDQLRTHGRELYEWLLAPVAQWLKPNETLVIEGDGELQKVPFAALVRPDGSWLGAQLAIEYSPGLAYRALARNLTPVSKTDRLLAVGDPAVELADESAPGRFPPLPLARKEAQAAISYFPNALPMLTGREATAAAVRSELPQASVFAFAGHAAWSPSGNVLLVAPGTTGHSGRLGSRDFDIQTLAHCKLAMLLACSTASTGRSNAFGTDALVSSMLRSGVPTVVATRWELDSDSAGRLSDFFYPFLLQGFSVSTALMKAEGVIRQEPGMAAPYYWAAYSAYGSRP